MSAMDFVYNANPWFRRIWAVRAGSYLQRLQTDAPLAGVVRVCCAISCGTVVALEVYIFEKGQVCNVRRNVIAAGSCRRRIPCEKTRRISRDEDARERKLRDKRD